MKFKTVFIIGASGGIGGAAARKILNEGGTVVNGSRTKCEIEGVHNMYVDVEKPETIARAVGNIVSEYGCIDYFIYSAGDSLAAPFEYTTDADLRHIFEVNFFGLSGALKEVVPIMRSFGGGRIVAVSSLGGEFPIPFDPFYSASKAAVNMFIKELNVELNPYNVYLTSLMPGGTATQFSYRRKVYSGGEAGIYADDMRRAADKLVGIEQNGDSPEVVADEILSVLKSKRPPLTATVGLKNKVMLAADKLMPQPWSSNINKRQYLE